MFVFLDVGAHTGETLDVVLDPRLAIGKVYAFEPATVCREILRGYRDPRLTVLPFGLSNTTGHATLHGAGLLGASVYADKQQLDDASCLETIDLQRASDWIRSHTDESDRILLKMNCEGSECDVLDDLLGHPDLLARLHSVYVDFDVRKIPSQADREAGIRQRLVSAGVPFTTPADLEASRDDALSAWLVRAGVPTVRSGVVRLAIYRFGHQRPLYVRARQTAAWFLPTGLYQGIARRYGVNSRRRQSP